MDGGGSLVWVDGEATVAFGRHESEALRTVALEAPDYIAWVMNGNCDAELKQILYRALEGGFPGR